MQREGPEKAESLYRGLFEASHDALLITERDGTIVAANAAAALLFGYDRDELTGLDIRRLYLNPDDRARFQEAIERAGFVRDFEVAFRARDGRRLDCLLTTAVRRGADGTVTGYQGIIHDVTERRRMEKRLRDYQRRLRSLTLELSMNQERERARIATDLHDGVLQLVVAAQLKLQALQRKGGSDEALIADLRALFDQMAHDLRSMTFDLSPPVLRRLGLVPGLQWLGEQIEDLHGLAVDLATEGDCAVPDPDMRALAFRCIRELLLNAARHAGTDRARVSLRGDETHLQVAVEDEGEGFDSGQIDFAAGSHFGLFSIRERIILVGGRFEIESAPGKGTRCLLAIPFSPPGQEDRSQ